MKQIIIDTNALMAIAELKLDIFSELERVCDFKYELLATGGIIKELENIMETQPGKYKRAAKLALALLKAKGVKVINEEGPVDDLLLAFSKKGYLILTQDKELKKKLQKPYMTIRQGKRMVVVN